MKKRAFLPVLALPILFSLEGCGGGGSSSNSSPAPTVFNRSVTLQTVRDPWTLARPRFLDAANRAFSAEFARTFSYRNARVTFSFPSTAPNRFLSGRVIGSGLKPNFAYQIKLVGKPVYGTRGWGAAGDDFANEALGRAGRWWNDSDPSANTNNSDEVFETLYKNPPASQKQTVYGYLFLGVFLTDAQGRADATFVGDKSYHITWQDEQNGIKDTLAGNFTLGSGSLGYGAPTQSKAIKLWYEFESGRPQPIRLPVGQYNCRLLLTEETFHNFDLDGPGGFWPTVLGSEDFSSNGASDSAAGNDVRFTIQG